MGGCETMGVNDVVLIGACVCGVGEEEEVVA
jgi:hypothetical protein